MTGRERIDVALQGGKADRVPIVPIYDYAYLMRSIGRDVREWHTHSTEERVQAIEKSFLRHEVDGFFVHGGTNGEWAEAHEIEKRDEYWLVTERSTGKQWRLLPDGWRAEADGTPVPRAPSTGGISRVQSRDDIDRLVPLPPSEDEIEASARFEPLRHLAHVYRDRHFSFQSGSPMVAAVNACGGFHEALLTLATDRALFAQLVERYVPISAAPMAAGRKAGACSTWFTTYYSGADTISPKDYTELVLPCEKRVCQAARDAGLYVLCWFLGDLIPILDKVMELPIDALVLEQGRKGYEIDPVKIRRRVGPRFCLFGFGFENDYCTFNREGLAGELRRQFEGAGKNGAFVAGTPIMPPNAVPEAVDFYFSEARRLGER